MWDKYCIANSLEEALKLLAEYNGDAVVIGGGTDLIPQFRNKKKSYRCLVDITRIESIRKIELNEGKIEIGGAVTHAMVTQSPMIQRYAHALAQGCGIVGSPQIRNVATLAGNIVNAQPAADGAVALVALDADAHIVSAKGKRIVPVKDLYVGVGKSKVDSTSEIIEKIVFRALDPKNHEASSVKRLALRKMLSLPMVNVAVCLKVNAEKFDWVRIAIGPMAQAPLRLLELEAELKGKIANEATICMEAQKLGLFVSPRDSKLRGSADYRKSMAQILTHRALHDALDRACQLTEEVE